MEIILYLSAAVAAVAFLILAIYLAKTLKSLQSTLDSVAHTLTGLEKQLDGVTRETTVLLHKTNTLADDIQQKSESLNSVVSAVKDVGNSVQRFNQSIHSISSMVDNQIDKNQDKISQVVQWSNVFLELKDKWKSRRMSPVDHQLDGGQLVTRQRERAKY
ncbi:DUF948 domain-containing protein [Mesobacillus foraminis]|jgi:uncharacterized protein YoxC|uniref:Uncharacterized protein YoxC n=1 Tax=Mesobacillus foraminis TaxID=279826 RepID=A0A4R2BBW0_9BACI|nr:DUF948 domain-containing protein [Mesobacillus foraminis]MBT2754418.1 DUF948 domain-containing protein [Mesobacillus foraminis]TCN24401.1 uncharacterized protein YoxC [Mesobacillus foraminis]